LAASPQVAVPFGKYELIRRLAVGGMAEVFLAKDDRGQLVAIKRILPHLSDQPEFVQMFLDEARIAAQLNHPNIVRTTDLGRQAGSIFLAMEYVEGVDLRSILKQQAKKGVAMPFGVAARIVCEVAKGLSYAHTSVGVDGRPLQIVHRDVSPQNVMVTFDGSVKLVDFGIARAGVAMQDSVPGMIKGKFLYLAPEQAQRIKIDHRADLFPLGSVLYEITTGKPAFARPNAEAIIHAVRFEEPTPAPQLREGFPTALARVISRCLVKDRDQRYPTAAALVDELESFLAGVAGGDRLAAAEHLAYLYGREDERTTLHIPSSARSPKAAEWAPGRKTPVMVPPVTTPLPRRADGSQPPQPIEASSLITETTDPAVDEPEDALAWVLGEEGPRTAPMRGSRLPGAPVRSPSPLSKRQGVMTAPTRPESGEAESTVGLPSPWMGQLRRGLRVPFVWILLSLLLLGALFARVVVHRTSSSRPSPGGRASGR
jgi:serine/threonine-protein kinase